MGFTHLGYICSDTILYTCVKATNKKSNITLYGGLFFTTDILPRLCIRVLLQTKSNA